MREEARTRPLRLPGARLTREEFEQVRCLLMSSGVCPACGAPFDMERLRTLLLVCANPTCNFSYQAALNERVEITRREGGPSPARLPLRES